LSAAVSDMLGGSVTNDLCNYANGKSNDVFPRKVCWQCNPVWGLILQSYFRLCFWAKTDSNRWNVNREI